MKLHLPKLLLTAVLAACSMAEAAMTAPVAGTEGYIWTWDGIQWTRDSDNSVSTPTRDGNVGAFMIVNADLSTNPNTSDSKDTSDGGGVHVKEGVQATDMDLGKWAGTIQVDAGAYLNASAEYLKNVNADTTVASVWVDGELNLRGFNKWDGNSTAQNWHIGKNGYINLVSASSIDGTASWNIELIHDKQEEAEIEGLTNRIRTNTAQFTRT
ncbi:MAG: hypothetical protein IKT79_01945, partial [Akkermansia sp.]|nr:hypothetical protein [Akkermansia sp.]